MIHKKKPDRQDVSLAVVWTKYQYHILLALLRTLNIDKTSVALIVFAKAKKQGVSGENFGRVVFYDAEENIGIKHWPHIKKDIGLLVKSIDFSPANIFIRNYDSAIGRVLLSQFKHAPLYLLEDGTISYTKRNYLGHTFGFKEIIRNILVRIYFGRGALKILPFFKKKAHKVGLFKSVKPWLNIPYIPIHLEKKDFQGDEQIDLKELKKYKVLILEQPLWAGKFTEEMLIDAYKEMHEYLLSDEEIEAGDIAVKLHPSTDKNKVLIVLKKANLQNKVTVLATNNNLEEILVSDALANINTIIGFCSSGLYVSRALLSDDTIKVIAFSTKEFRAICHKEYTMYEEMGIVHAKGNK